MTSLVVSLGGWSWIVAGLALLILEVLAPGAFMMWLGLAALGVGIVSLTIDWSWQARVVGVAPLRGAAIPPWRRGRPARRAPRGHPRVPPPAPTRWSDILMCWISRSSRAPDGCASMTRCGRCTVPICRPARVCASPPPMARH